MPLIPASGEMIILLTTAPLLRGGLTPSFWVPAVFLYSIAVVLLKEVTASVLTDQVHTLWKERARNSGKRGEVFKKIHQEMSTAHEDDMSTSI